MRRRRRLGAGSWLTKGLDLARGAVVGSLDSVVGYETDSCCAAVVHSVVPRAQHKPKGGMLALAHWTQSPSRVHDVNLHRGPGPPGLLRAPLRLHLCTTLSPLRAPLEPALS